MAAFEKNRFDHTTQSCLERSCRRLVHESTSIHALHQTHRCRSRRTSILGYPLSDQIVVRQPAAVTTRCLSIFLILRHALLFFCRPRANAPTFCHQTSAPVFLAIPKQTFPLFCHPEASAAPPKDLNVSPYPILAILALAQLFVAPASRRSPPFFWSAAARLPRASRDAAFIFPHFWINVVCSATVTHRPFCFTYTRVNQYAPL